MTTPIRDALAELPDHEMLRAAFVRMLLESLVIEVDAERERLRSEADELHRVLNEVVWEAHEVMRERDELAAQLKGTA